MDTQALSSGPLMTPADVSVFLGVPTSTLAVWRSTGRVVLPFVKVGAHVRYRREVVEEFISGKQGSRPATAIQMKPIAPASASQRAGTKTGRVAEYLQRHGRLVCERCGCTAAEANAVIVSQLELPSLEGPRDPHDWHCYCASCHRQLAQKPERLQDAAKQSPLPHPPGFRFM